MTSFHSPFPASTRLLQPLRATVIACAVAAALLAPAFAEAAAAESAAAESRVQFDVPAGPLDSALNRFGRQAGVMLSVDAALTQGIASPGVKGEMTTEAALRQLLSGTGLAAERGGDGSYRLVRSQSSVLPAVMVSADSIQESAYGPVNGFVAKRSATGSKTDTPIVEIPQSISVVTADRVEKMGASTLKDALSYTPGINVSPWGNDSQYDWVYLRGFDAYSPGFYMDGLQLRNSGSWAVWQTENYGLERIEYLRGPASVLYGQNSAGGLINVVSKRPTANPVRELQLQLGNDSHRQIATDLSGQVGDDETWLYRLTALAKDAELSVGDDLPNDRQYIAPAVTWAPSADTKLTLLAQYLDMDVASNWSAYPARGTLLPNPNGKIPYSFFVGEKDFSLYDQKQWMVGYLFEHHFNDTWTVRQNARHSEFDTDYQTFYGVRFATVNPGDPADPANFRLLNRTPFGSYETASQFALDNQVEAKWQFGRWRHTLLLGVDYQQTDFDVTAFWGGTASPIDAYQPVYGSAVTLVSSPFVNSDTELGQTGYYIQDQIKFDERWVIALAGRFDHAVINTHDRLDSSHTKQSDDHFTGQAGVVYLASNGLAPYVNYSESFSPTTTIDPATGKPFDPSTGRQYEAGVRYQPSGTNGIFSVAAFDVVRQNYVTNDASFVPKNNGEVTVRGIELEAVVEPMPNMNVVAAYSWTPIADVTESANANEIDKRSFNYAENQFSLWSDYTFNLGVTAGLGARYTGTTTGANEAAPIKLPDYTLFDALIGYEFESWELAINARNLGNKEYIANCSGAGTSCSYGDSREVIGTLSYRW